VVSNLWIFPYAVKNYRYSCPHISCIAQIPSLRQEKSEWRRGDYNFEQSTGIQGKMEADASHGISSLFPPTVISRNCIFYPISCFSMSLLVLLAGSKSFYICCVSIEIVKFRNYTSERRSSGRQEPENFGEIALRSCLSLRQILYQLVLFLRPYGWVAMILDSSAFLSFASFYSDVCMWFISSRFFT
jgi:hypothetical protein